jgi:hypothetical protein
MVDVYIRRRVQREEKGENVCSKYSDISCSQLFTNYRNEVFGLMTDETPSLTDNCRHRNKTTNLYLHVGVSNSRLNKTKPNTLCGSLYWSCNNLVVA